MVSGCSGGTDPEVSPNPAVAVVLSSGAEQVRFPGTPLLSAFVLQLVDAAGEATAVSGLPVSWVVTRGGGSVAAQDTTDDNGLWRGVLTLGDEVGVHELDVSIADLTPIGLTARAVDPGPIAFISNRRAGFTGDAVAGFPGDLYVMNDDGTDVVLLSLSNLPFEYASHPAWRPDGGEVLVNRVEPRPAGGTPGAIALGVFATDPSGQTQRRIPAGPEPAYAVQLREPGWSPTGGAIVAHRWDTQRLYTFAPSGTDYAEVSTPDGAVRSAKWSTDGNRFTYVCGGNICVAERSGANAMQLTAGGADGEPAWSPDGTQILFSRDSVGGGGIWLMNDDGTDAHQVLDGSATGPSWSPDGERFAASVKTAEGADLWVVTWATGEARNITSNSWIDRQPSWRRTGIP